LLFHETNFALEREINFWGENEVRTHKFVSWNPLGKGPRRRFDFVQICLVGIGSGLNNSRAQVTVKLFLKCAKTSLLWLLHFFG